LANKQKLIKVKDLMFKTVTITGAQNWSKRPLPHNTAVYFIRNCIKSSQKDRRGAFFPKFT
jgi:hypothetical protein